MNSDLMDFLIEAIGESPMSADKLLGAVSDGFKTGGETMRLTSPEISALAETAAIANEKNLTTTEIRRQFEDSLQLRLSNSNLLN